MSNDHKTAENIDADIPESPETPITESSDLSKKKRRTWPWLILLVLLCISTLSFLYLPMDKLTQSFASLNWNAMISQRNNTPTEVSSIAAPTDTDTTELPLITAIKNDTLAAQPIEPEIAEAASTDMPRQQQILNDHYDDLQLRIDDLEQLVQTLQASNIQTAQMLKRFESLQLRTQLNIIVRGHLPEINQAWQDIASFPSLSDEQRLVAENMAQQSQKNMNTIQHWQQAMDDISSLLPLPQTHNIIPEPSSPWLQWINGYFSLKKAPNNKLTELESLLKIQQQLNEEIWPESTDWSRIRVNLEKALTSQKAVNAAELISALPETFKDIQHDIETMKQTASHWLEE